MIELVERADGSQFGPREISERVKIEVIDGLEADKGYQSSTKDSQCRVSMQLDG